MDLIPTTAHALIEGVAQAEGVTVEALLGRNRAHRLAGARHRAWAVLRQERYTAAEVAAWFGVTPQAVTDADRRKRGVDRLGE